MARFRMTRIERPRWADAPDVWLRDIRLAEYEAVQRRRSRLLAAVHREVERYLRNPRLVYDDPADDGFPNLARMTGEYYLGDERYEADGGVLRVAVTCRCLAKPLTPRMRRADDYLGLDVWLRCEPPNWTFTVFRNTDSSVI